MRVEKAKLIGTLPQLPTEVSITFDIFPTGTVSGWSSIFHMTTGGNQGNGYRIPGVWFHSQTTRILFDNKYDFNSASIPIHQWTRIEILQEEDDSPTQYLYTIKINNTVAYSNVGTQPQTYENVLVYAGDPWYNPSPALIRRLNVNGNSFIERCLHISHVIPESHTATSFQITILYKDGTSRNVNLGATPDDWTTEICETNEFSQIVLILPASTSVKIWYDLGTLSCYQNCYCWRDNCKPETLVTLSSVVSPNEIHCPVACTLQVRTPDSNNRAISSATGNVHATLVVHTTWDATFELYPCQTDLSTGALVIFSVTSADTEIIRVELYSNWDQSKIRSAVPEAVVEADITLDTYSHVSIIQYQYEKDHFLEIEINGVLVSQTWLNEVKIQHIAQLVGGNVTDHCKIKNFIYRTYKSPVAPVECEVGTYSNKTGQSECTECPVGMTCPTLGTVQPQICPDGTILQYGFCAPCPIGYFCADKIQTPCPQGTYCKMGQSNYMMCPPGYFGTSEKASDMSSCLTLPTFSGCEPNLLPNVTNCNCITGYEGNVTTQCNNINECNNSKPCDEHAVCNDTMGSYNCTCQIGFFGTGHNCTNIDECLVENICPNGECVDNIGSFNCNCKPGFEKTAAGECENIDECLTDNRCPNGTCIDNIGSFDCNCNPGFGKSTAGACENIDECANAGVSKFLSLASETLQTCHEHECRVCSSTEECIDTVGSFYCTSLANKPIKERIGDLTNVLSTLAQPVNESMAASRPPAENDEDIFQRSQMVSPLLKDLQSLAFGDGKAVSKVDMLGRLKSANQAMFRYGIHRELKSAKYLLVQTMKNAKTLLKYGNADAQVGISGFQLIRKSANHRSERDVQSKPILVGRHKIQLPDSAAATIISMDENVYKDSKMNKEPLSKFFLDSQSVESVMISSLNDEISEPITKMLQPQMLSIIKLEPDSTENLFIWISGFNPEISITVYIGYNIPPQPKLLMFEFKVKLPASNFDSEFSTAKCVSDVCDNPFDNVLGDPFGIFLKRSELELCESKSATTCVLYVALEVESIVHANELVNISVRV